MRWSPDLKKTIRLRRQTSGTQSNCGKGPCQQPGASAELKDAVKVCRQSGLFPSISGANGAQASPGWPPQP
jgi:hypothetical protein